MSDISGALKTLSAWACGIFTAGYGIHSCTNTEWYKESRKQDEVEAIAAATPHVIRQADGCKVYAFRANSYDHYFTRCGEVVTTERSGSESCGKNCSRRTSEVIVTNGNKP